MHRFQPCPNYYAVLMDRGEFDKTEMIVTLGDGGFDFFSQPHSFQRKAKEHCPEENTKQSLQSSAMYSLTQISLSNFFKVFLCKKYTIICYS